MNTSLFNSLKITVFHAGIQKNTIMKALPLLLVFLLGVTCGTAEVADQCPSEWFDVTLSGMVDNIDPRNFSTSYAMTMNKSSRPFRMCLSSSMKDLGWISHSQYQIHLGDESSNLSKFIPHIIPAIVFWW